MIKEKIKGIIKSYDENRGFGFIDEIGVKNKSYFFHSSNLKNNFEIEQLIKNVTTPGGCTEVGNKVLNESNISEIIDKLINDTMKKAIELG